MASRPWHSRSSHFPFTPLNLQPPPSTTVPLSRAGPPSLLPPPRPPPAQDPGRSRCPQKASVTGRCQGSEVTRLPWQDNARQCARDRDGGCALSRPDVTSPSSLRLCRPWYPCEWHAAGEGAGSEKGLLRLLDIWEQSSVRASAN